VTLPEVVCTGEVGFSGTRIVDKTFKILRRQHFGPASTKGDGECLLRAVLQTMVLGESNPQKSLQKASSFAEDNIALLRESVCVEIMNNIEIQSYFNDNTFICMLNDLNTRRRCGQLIDQYGTDHFVFAQMFGTLYRDGGIWYNFVGIRCLAIYLDMNIACIDVNSDRLVVYPRKFGPYHIAGTSRCYKKDEVSIHCVDRSGAFIPRFVFDFDATLVLAYNGKDHFWFTQAMKDIATTETLELIQNARIVDLIPGIPPII